MTLYEFTIDVDLRTIIHSTEVQEYLFFIPVRWDGNIALIPHLFDEIGIAYSRKFTFRAEGYSDVLIKLLCRLQTAVFS